MTYHSMSPGLKAMTKARVNLTLDAPFFGTLALRMRLIEDPQTKTASIDGRCIRFNSEFVLGLSGPERKALLAHEIMHVVYMHHVRRGAREPRKWNVAGDYVINPVLDDAGFTLPEGALLDNSLKNLTTDHVYNMLPETPKGEGGEGGEDGEGPSWGEVVDMPNGSSESERQREEQEVKINTAQAARVAKMAGKLPAGLERFVDDLMRPQVDWREKLRTFITAIARDDYSWTRPNRRYIQQGIYMPSLYSERAKKFAVVIDTSGSIGQAELNAFISEINAIAVDVAPEEIDILDCDCRLNAVTSVSEYPINWSNVSIKGGGGTSFVPPFEHYANNIDAEPQCLIYLTDMYGDFPAQSPVFPTLWVSTTDVRDAPFGEVVQIDV